MIKLDKVSKKFPTGNYALSNLTLTVDKGEFVFLVGPTGSGKTTIFKLLIREILPSDGKIFINDWEVAKLDKKRVPYLRKKVGVIFQDLKMLADRTLLENVLLPLEINGFKTDEAKRKAEEMLNTVGLKSHKDKFPIQLSGGELQRAAIARALVLSPDILLADEATGNLDMATSWEITNLLLDINKKGTTVVMATHNLDIVKNLSKRTVELDKGALIRDTKEKTKKAEKISDDEIMEETKDEKKNEVKEEEKNETP